MPLNTLKNKITTTNYKDNKNIIIELNTLFIEEYKDKSYGNRRRTNHPICSSAQKVWKKSFSDGNVDFNLFYHLSQMNCSYCNSLPSTLYNKFKYSKTSLPISIERGNFIYNGLDRLTSKKSHTKDNVLTCCYSCNTFKLDQEYDQFRDRVIRLYNNIPNFEHLIEKSETILTPI